MPDPLQIPADPSQIDPHYESYLAMLDDDQKAEFRRRHLEAVRKRQRLARPTLRPAVKRRLSNANPRDRRDDE